MNGLTANYNNYSAAELEKALQSWVEPYPKPIILNHDLNSEPLGRIIAARMDTEEDGSPYVRLQLAITDPVAAQKIADKRYLTGSVGGRAGKAVCSITGEDLASEDASGRPRTAKYKRGQVYKGKLSYIDMQDISFKEYSFVNQPADQRSGVRNPKSKEGSAPIADSENWVAKSSAFVLHMDNEDIISVEENESIFKNMKKKESRPVYLHVKGAFLTALALQESENGNNNGSSLLSVEDSVTKNSEETHKMDDVKENENILAVAEELSEDLSNIASGIVEESEETSAKESPETKAPEAEEAPKEETSKEEAPEAEEKVTEETVTDEAADELKKANQKIAQLEAQIAKDSSTATAADEQESTVVPESVEELALEAVESTNSEVAEENKVDEDSKVELTDNNVVSEQDADDLIKKLRLLEEENQKLKSALHRTLAERVVDTKITVGAESVEDREQLIKDHVTRSAGSLADSLRDLVKLPIAKKNIHALSESVLVSDVISEKEENVLEEDEEIVEAPKSKVNSAEELFVDALMGRRKL
jgi:hypothetical protein